MTTYTDVFGGATIYPTEISYSSYTNPTTDIVLSWPEETSASNNLATKIIDINSTTVSVSFYLPSAAKAGTGETILFNNKGSNTILVKNAGGTQIVSLSAGTAWQVYLTNNTTTNGSWQVVQFGASVSQANASALAGTGIVAVGALLSQSVPVTSFSTSYTATTTDRAKMFLWTGAAGTLTLTSAVALGDNWFIYVRNGGSGTLTVDPAGSILINGSSTLAFQPGDSAIIASDGANFYTIGFGQSATFAFTYTVINVPGTGNYTLSGTELNQVAYKFTGALTGNRNIIVPNTIQQYWVDNSTTGAYTLTIKTAAGTGYAVNQNARAITYCDGTNVVNADTASIAFPISIANGGTGQTTAGAALIALGGTSTGIALFTSASQAAAWAALGVAQLGTVDGGTF